jgi:hypothetical protein
MGVSQSCTLDQLSNLCQMHQCIAHIKGYKSNSASATDTWECELKPGTTFQGKPVLSTFMKIGINPASMPKPNAEQTALKRQMATDRIQAASGLMYEFQVYHDIVTPILDADICPNFLRSYLISYNCKYSDLLDSLRIGLSPDIDPSEVHRHLNRNISFLYQGTEKRPAIQSRSDLDHQKPSSKLRYMVLTTEFNDVEDYWVWLSSPHTVRSRQAVLLQILMALYVMSKSKLMHNDLRAPNIFVQRLREPETWTYVINDQSPITVYTPYKALVYDFDRGTSASLGVNVFVKESGLYPADMGLFEENRDLVCLYKSLLGGHEVDSLIPEYFDVRNVNEKTEWFLGRGYEVPTSLQTAIRRLSHAFDLPPSDRVYRINDDMFMRDGTLNRDHADLSALRAANEQHEKVVADYKVILENCNAEKRRLENELAELS